MLVTELTSLNTDNVEDDDNEDVAQSSTGLYYDIVGRRCSLSAVAWNVVTQLI